MTGFISERETSLRLKQGLLPQDIANICAPKGAKCNQQTMNPAGVVKIP